MHHDGMGARERPLERLEGQQDCTRLDARMAGALESWIDEGNEREKREEQKRRGERKRTRKQPGSRQIWIRKK